MLVTLINQSQISMPRRFIGRSLALVEEELKRRKGLSSKIKSKELVIVCVDLPRAKQLNKDFRKKAYATDVLSFDGEGKLLGELVLCSQVVKRQSLEHGLSYRDEMIYLVIHGLLHLLGFEHEWGGAQAEKMVALQDDIFSKVLDSK